MLPCTLIRMYDCDMIYYMCCAFPKASGRSAIFYGAEKGDLEIVKLLIQSEPNLNLKDKVSSCDLMSRALPLPLTLHATWYHLWYTMHMQLEGVRFEVGNYSRALQERYQYRYVYLISQDLLLTLIT